MLKIDDSIKGFINKNGNYAPFEFDKDSFQLKLFDSYDEWIDSTDPKTVFEKFFAEYNTKDTKEIEFIKMEGITSDKRTIIFNTANLPSEKRGFKVYPCVWVYITSNNNAKNIHGIRITGGTIENYYPSYRVYSVSMQEAKNKNGFDEFIVRAKSSVSEKVGKMENCSFSIQSHATLKSRQTEPLTSGTRLLVTFDSPMNIDETELLCLHIYQTFRYLSYRNNININDFEILGKDKGGILFSLGILSIHLKQYDDEATKNESFILNHDIIGDKFAKIIEMYSSETIPCTYLPNSFLERNTYEPSRIYMILADFDYQFKKTYSLDEKSKTLKDSKKRALDIIQKELEIEKDESVMNDFIRISEAIKRVNNSFSYSKSLEYAFENNKTIMSPFVNQYYSGGYDDAVKSITNCIKEIRHSFSHGSHETNILQEQLKNIQMIERLNYVLILIRAGITETEIIKGINNLFCDKLNI